MAKPTKTEFGFKVVDDILPKTGIRTSAFATGRGCVVYRPDVWSYPQKNASASGSRTALSVFDNFKHAESFRSAHTHQWNDLRLETWLCAFKKDDCKSQNDPPGTIRASAVRIVQRCDNLPRQTREEMMAKTPDEIAEFKRRLLDGECCTEEQTKLLVAIFKFTADLMAEPPDPPAPPTKAERIRECIKRVQSVDTELYMSYMADPNPVRCYQALVRQLISLLQEDDCNV